MTSQLPRRKISFRCVVYSVVVAHNSNTAAVVRHGLKWPPVAAAALLVVVVVAVVVAVLVVVAVRRSSSSYPFLSVLIRSFVRSVIRSFVRSFGHRPVQFVRAASVVAASRPCATTTQRNANA